MRIFDHQPDMIKEFDSLEGPEVELMLRAPLLVCILIAGADDNIDRNEMKGAIELAQKKQKKGRAALLEYYKTAAEDFEDKLKIILQGYPSGVEEREPVILRELERLNSVLPKLPEEFARAFYKSMRDIAKSIAESSGGVFGINKVHDHELRHIDLPMIKEPAV